MSKRINTPRAANTYQGAAGGTGHFQDTDVLGGTQFDAMWCEAMQEDVIGTILGLGGVLSGTEAAQLWGLLGPRVQGQKAHATDTGVVSTAQDRVVVGSVASRASMGQAVVAASIDSEASAVRSFVAGSSSGFAGGPQSAVIGCVQASTSGAGSAAIACTDPATGGNQTAQGERSAGLASLNCKATGIGSVVIASATCIASAPESAMIATNNGEASGESSVVIGSFNCFAGGARSVVVGSLNCENVESETIAMGLDFAPIAKTGFNQNRKIILRATTGAGEFVGPISASNVTLAADKAVSRYISLASATPLAAGDWTLNGPPIAGQTILHWTPSALGKYLFVPIQCRGGEKLAKVTAYNRCSVTPGSTIRGRVLATDATGLTLVSDEVTWTTASDGAKDLACSDHVYATGRSYYIAFWVGGADVAPVEATEGLQSVRLYELIGEI